MGISFSYFPPDFFFGRPGHSTVGIKDIISKSPAHVKGYEIFMPFKHKIVTISDFWVYKTGNICYNGMIIQWITVAFAKNSDFTPQRSAKRRFYVKQKEF
jgi:hypothetical protein